MAWAQCDTPLFLHGLLAMPVICPINHYNQVCSVWSSTSISTVTSVFFFQFCDVATRVFFPQIPQVGVLARIN
jgi:hypothetical protein